MGLSAVATTLLLPAAMAAVGGSSLHTVAAVPREHSSSPKLYVCQGGQCVLNAAGVPRKTGASKPVRALRSDSWPD